jgi:enoyl-CoA hydratase
MAEGSVLTELRDGALVVTINRPGAGNALDPSVGKGLVDALATAAGDPDVRSVIVTGAGDKVFCAGMDLKAFARGELPVVEGRGLAGLVQRPPRKPLIAAVEGYALGGGFEIALACDLIVAATTATFGLPEVKRGLTAAGGGLLRLQHRIPFHLAMELVLTGRMWSAGEAAEVHLVNRLAEPGGALAAALDLADEVAANAPLALAASKQVLVRSTDWPEAEKFARQEEHVNPVRLSADAKEGALAFREKRVPEWTGS